MQQVDRIGASFVCFLSNCVYREPFFFNQPPPYEFSPPRGDYYVKNCTHRKHTKYHNTPTQSTVFLSAGRLF